MRRALALSLGLFWGFNYLLSILTWLWYPYGQPANPYTPAIRLGLSVFGCGLCLLIYALLSRYRQKRRWATTVALGAGLAVVMAVPYAATQTYVSHWLNGTSADPIEIVLTGIYWVWFFIAWTTLNLAVAYGFDIRAEEERSARLREQAQVAQLEALRYQLNPHLLYNTLNSLSALVGDGNTGATQAMIGRLANFFRSSLASDANIDVRLAEEIALQRLYLEIEQVRFPNLRIESDITPEAGEARVPPLILQPIVENAVKFGVAASRYATTIRFSAAKSGDDLAIMVENDGRPTRTVAHGTGTGLRNVRTRLDVQYGLQARMTTADSDGGFRVEIRLPYQT